MICVHCEAELDAREHSGEDLCPECGDVISGMSRCVECGEMKSDPGDFYDGLRCTVCCEESEESEDDT